MTRENRNLNYEKQNEANLHNTEKSYERISSANLQLSKSRQSMEKGITLIALVITVIILLIIARSNNSNGNIRNRAI